MGSNSVVGRWCLGALLQNSEVRDSLFESMPLGARQVQAISRRYRTRNWSSSNASRRKRGSLLIWVDKDVIWRAPRDGRPGRPAVFCDAAIRFCLSIKILFKPPLRQTCGMVARLLKLAGLDWAVPDYTTLWRRQKTLTVQIPFHRADGPLNRLVPLGTLLRNALPGSGRRVRYTSLPHRHPRARPHSDHPDPKERAGVQRRCYPAVVCLQTTRGRHRQGT